MQARRDFKRARRTQGFNLVELMITIAIIALLSGAVGFQVMEMYAESQKKAAALDCGQIKHAVQAAVIDGRVRPRECPTVQRLVELRILDEDQRANDPWDQPYRVHCEGDRVVVSSLGSDGVAGTDDDIDSRRRR